MNRVTDGDRVDAAELTRALPSAELAEIIRVLVEDHHAMVVETVGDENSPSGRNATSCGCQSVCRRCLTFSRQRVFSSFLPSFERTNLTDVVDTRRGVRMPGLMRIDATRTHDPAEVVPLRPSALTCLAIERVEFCHTRRRWRSEC